MTEQHYETCIHCGSHTGKAGASEDSIYLGTVGPFCEDCYDETGFYKLESELETLSNALAAAQVFAIELKTELEALKKATEVLAQAWRECPEDSVPDILQDVFVEIELANIPEGQNDQEENTN